MRDARISDGQAYCPWCGSQDVRYTEEVTNHHLIRRVEDGLVMVLDPDCETDPEAKNGRVTCMECGRESVLPVDIVVMFGQRDVHLR